VLRNFSVAAAGAAVSAGAAGATVSAGGGPLGSASTLPLPAGSNMFVAVDWLFDDEPPPHAVAIASSETAKADLVHFRCAVIFFLPCFSCPALFS
jgi:hypothetical protein